MKKLSKRATEAAAARSSDLRTALADVVLVRRARRRRRPKVLVYTDSRGYDVRSRGRQNASGSWIRGLRHEFEVHYTLCPEQFTTIVDFVRAWEASARDFDAVVMHCGIVDFSPRPLSNIEKVKNSKAGIADFDELFAVNNDRYANPSSVQYRGEPTTTLYSTDYLKSAIVPRLAEIPRLLWISSNDFVPGWDGNYDRGRPSSIDQTVRSYDELLLENLANVVNLRLLWSHDDVQKWTIDNIHFTSEGNRHLGDIVARRLKSLTSD